MIYMIYPIVGAQIGKQAHKSLVEFTPFTVEEKSIGSRRPANTSRGTG